MSKNNELNLDPQKLLELGVPGDVVEKLFDGSIPAVNASAQGGRGGRAISLTYVDNYSTLLLVYTFLLNLLDGDLAKGSTLVNKSLLTTLKTQMEEQQSYRKAFLDAVDKLNRS